MAGVFWCVETTQQLPGGGDDGVDIGTGLTGSPPEAGGTGLVSVGVGAAPEGAGQLTVVLEAGGGAAAADDPALGAEALERAGAGAAAADDVPAGALAPVAGLAPSTATPSSSPTAPRHAAVPRGARRGATALVVAAAAPEGLVVRSHLGLR